MNSYINKKCGRYYVKKKIIDIFMNINTKIMKPTLLILCLLLTSVIANAQATYYKMPSGRVIDQATYDENLKDAATRGSVDAKIIETRLAQDSVIKTATINILVFNKDGKAFDPYAKFRKRSGKHFPIERFRNANGKKYDATALNGKPTIINFWFTRCPPCIEEIPKLNNLKAKFGDKVNFLAITYEYADVVERFLKTKNINFEHITNVPSQMKKLGIDAYPLNLLLDTNGNLLFVYGEISNFDEEIATVFNSLITGQDLK
jgi:cytochrome c biogenesis protein CcmG/thiol:disulfide interchange protein DsbE